MFIILFKKEINNSGNTLEMYCVNVKKKLVVNKKKKLGY